MESDRDPRARGDHARGGQPRGRARAPSAAGWTGWPTAASRRSPASTRARWCATSATRARCAAASSRRRCPRREARELIAAEPSMAGRDLAREVTPAATAHTARLRRRRSADRRDRHRHQGLDRRATSSRAARRRRCTPARVSAEELLATDPDAFFLANGPGDPAALGLRRRHRARAGRQAPGLGHLPRPPAALPGGRAGDLQAAVRPPRRQPPGQGPADRQDRDHLAEPRLRGARARRRRARSTPTSRCAGRPTSARPS